jgi:hypothetical protein
MMKYISIATDFGDHLIASHKEISPPSMGSRRGGEHDYYVIGTAVNAQEAARIVEGLNQQAEALEDAKKPQVYRP